MIYCPHRDDYEEVLDQAQVRLAEEDSSEVPAYFSRRYEIGRTLSSENFPQAVSIVTHRMTASRADSSRMFLFVFIIVFSFVPLQIGKSVSITLRIRHPWGLLSSEGKFAFRLFGKIHSKARRYGQSPSRDLP